MKVIKIRATEHATLWLLAIYIVVLSFVLKTVLIPATIAWVVLFFLRNRLDREISNFLYVLAAGSAVFSFFVFFAIYLPFSAIGLLLNKSGFIKRYLMGWGLAVFATLLVYITTIFARIPLTSWTILATFFFPAALLLSKAIFQKKYSTLIKVDGKEAKALIICFLAIFTVGHYILEDGNLFNSNGTWLYSKFYVIPKDIGKFGEFPHYQPYMANGEFAYLADSPASYSHIGLVYMFLGGIEPVLFWNSFQLFILFMIMLGTYLIIASCTKKESFATPYIFGLASAAVGINFVSLQFLESYKMMFSVPIGLLILSMALDNPRGLDEFGLMFLYGALMIVTHPANTLGIIIFSGTILLLLQTQKDSLWSRRKELARHIKQERIKIFLVVIAFMVLLFYLAPNLYYRDFNRGAGQSVRFDTHEIVEYFRHFFVDDTPFSFRHPDPLRNDDKKMGPFLSALGALAILWALLRWKKGSFTMARILAATFVIAMVVSSFANLFPTVGNIEYGDRILMFHQLVFFAAVIAIVINEESKWLRILLAAILLIGIIATVPFEIENFTGIHKESVINGERYSSELDFISKLSMDGRMITYAIFSNAFDPAVHILTDRYTARYEFNQFDESKTVYTKIHSSHSWGFTPALQNLTSIEFGNYLRAGGYQYVFVNACEPLGRSVVQVLMQGQAYPIYQNKEYLCDVILKMNYSFYSEKVIVAPEAMLEDLRKLEGGFVAVSLLPKEGWYDIGGYQQMPESFAYEPLPWKRIKQDEIVITGNFKDGDWVVFKEHYFPRWHAYMGGEEIPVLSSTEYLILMKARAGNEIILKVELNALEKVSAMVSALAILGLYLLAWLWI
ncbi:MAG: hypothetical protein QS98_C0011G0031 [archaeon GW2011_AR3]|nr:MAG: hypothetical protein QS98_C0011G0031 [archaeon GW2011_AR3]MBS3109707.1 hypothetical protein [Candidatus Woesearchaeota archaeon]